MDSVLRLLAEDPSVEESLIREFDVADRNEVLSLLVECIERLPQAPKKVLALFYCESCQLDDIAAALDLTEYEVDQIRAKALRDLETMLAARLGLERHARNCEKLFSS
jgi:RNA polymerase sigma factor for flagellar operon FliA